MKNFSLCRDNQFENYLFSLHMIHPVTRYQSDGQSRVINNRRVWGDAGNKQICAT